MKRWFSSSKLVPLLFLGSITAVYACIDSGKSDLMKRAINVADANRDGRIDSDEAKNVYRVLGLKVEDKPCLDYLSKGQLERYIEVYGN